MADRTPLVQTLAAAYADAVLAVLVEEFPALDESRLGGLGQLVQRAVAEHAAAPGRLEVIVTYTREWRLVPDRAGEDRWRVQVACHRDQPTDDDSVRERRINAALRSIQVSLDAIDRRSRGRT